MEGGLKEIFELCNNPINATSDSALSKPQGFGQLAAL